VTELLNVVDAAKVVKVNRRTVFNWMANGKVEYVVLPSGARRILASSLIKPGNVSVLVRADYHRDGELGVVKECAQVHG
jgi:predicted site-specific integrase-resolvase